MKISDQEIKKALKIKNAVQIFLEQTKKVNLRSTDVFPYLVRRGLYEQDYRNGLYFRQFLKRLYKANMLLSLIPQCRYVPGINGEIYGEWYFNIYRKVAVKVINEEKVKESRVPVVTESMSYDDARDNLWQLIQDINPLTGELLNELEDSSLILIGTSLKIFMEADASSDKEKTGEHSDKISEKEKQTPSITESAECSINNSHKNYIEEIRQTNANAYNPWSKEEESLLTNFYKENYKVLEIAKKLKRQPGAIRSRLKKLGLRD